MIYICINRHTGVSILVKKTYRFMSPSNRTLPPYKHATGDELWIVIVALTFPLWFPLCMFVCMFCCVFSYMCIKAIFYFFRCFLLYIVRIFVGGTKDRLLRITSETALPEVEVVVQPYSLRPVPIGIIVADPNESEKCPNSLQLPKCFSQFVIWSPSLQLP